MPQPEGSCVRLTGFLSPGQEQDAAAMFKLVSEAYDVLSDGKPFVFSPHAVYIFDSAVQLRSERSMTASATRDCGGGRRQAQATLTSTSGALRICLGRALGMPLLRDDR